MEMQTNSEKGKLPGFKTYFKWNKTKQSTLRQWGIGYLCRIESGNRFTHTWWSDFQRGTQIIQCGKR